MEGAVKLRRASASLANRRMWIRAPTSPVGCRDRKPLSLVTSDGFGSRLPGRAVGASFLLEEMKGLEDSKEEPSWQIKEMSSRAW